MSKTAILPQYALLKKRNRWRRRFYILLACWLMTTILLSFRPVRGGIAYPLFVHDPDAAGDAAYVMADGYAYWERVRAASDLYHMGRVPRLIVLAENEPAGYSFVQKSTQTRLQRTIEYFGLLGVPAEDISTVSVPSSAMFGSLSEARAVAKQEPDLRRLVVVTSAAHTRRSQLSFRRSMPPQVEIQCFAASQPGESVEIDGPLWIEYAKLAVYFFVAR
ncbi:YdcF family protein [Planctomycetaceae bacterium SH139]